MTSFAFYFCLHSVYLFLLELFCPYFARRGNLAGASPCVQENETHPFEGIQLKMRLPRAPGWFRSLQYNVRLFLALTTQVLRPTSNREWIASKDGDKSVEHDIPLIAHGRQ